MPCVLLLQQVLQFFVILQIRFARILFRGIDAHQSVSIVARNNDIRWMQTIGVIDAKDFVHYITTGRGVIVKFAIAAIEFVADA